MGARLIFEEIDRVRRNSDVVVICDHSSNSHPTWKQFLEDQVVPIANILHQDVGLDHGSVVGITARSSVPYVALFMALASLDCVIAPVSPNWSDAEIVEANKALQIQAYLVPAGTDAPDIMHKWECRTLPGGSLVYFQSAEKSVHKSEDSLSQEEAGVVVFTSGSTGEPKGVVLRPQAILKNAVEVSRTLRMQEGGNHVSLYRLYHVAGLVIDLVAPLISNLTTCYSGEFNAERILPHIGESDFTTSSFFEFQIRRIMTKLENKTLGELGLKTCYIAGPPHMYDLCEEQRIGSIASLYALTEGTSPVIHIHADETDREVRKYTNGKPLQGVKIELRETEGNEPGTFELGFDGYNRFLGYAGEKPWSGMYWTQDLVKPDGKGNYSYVGRSSLIVKTGGENVSCIEVEGLLEEILADEIEQVIVVGAPSREWGEMLVAFVQPRKQVDESGWREQCRGKMANFKVPKKFFGLGPSEWPSLPNGKLDRRTLKNWAAERTS